MKIDDAVLYMVKAVETNLIQRGLVHEATRHNALGHWFDPSDRAFHLACRCGWGAHIMGIYEDEGMDEKECDPLWRNHLDYIIHIVLGQPIVFHTKKQPITPGPIVPTTGAGLGVVGLSQAGKLGGTPATQDGQAQDPQTAQQVQDTNWPLPPAGPTKATWLEQWGDTFALDYRRNLPSYKLLVKAQTKASKQEHKEAWDVFFSPTEKARCLCGAGWVDGKCSAVGVDPGK